MESTKGGAPGETVSQIRRTQPATERGRRSCGEARSGASTATVCGRRRPNGIDKASGRSRRNTAGLRERLHIPTARTGRWLKPLADTTGGLRASWKEPNRRDTRPGVAGVIPRLSAFRVCGGYVTRPFSRHFCSEGRFYTPQLQTSQKRSILAHGRRSTSQLTFGYRSGRKGGRGSCRRKVKAGTSGRPRTSCRCGTR